MEQAPTYLRLRGIPFVTLYVGLAKTVYHVHKDLLFEASPVFKAALSGQFVESSTRSMNILDDDVDAVERMLQWLYTKKFELTNVVSKATSSICFCELAELNTLADKYDIVALKNAIIDKLFELYRLSLTSTEKVQPPQMPVIIYIYNNTTEKSALRKIMVAWAAWGIDLSWYKLLTTRD